MKKILSIVLITVMLASVFCLGVSALDEPDANPADEIPEDNGVNETPGANNDPDEPVAPVSVYVTVATEGSLDLRQESITVIDIDGDEVLTVNDALYCAHKERYEGALEDGYASEETEYGLSLTKLWGNDCGSYGYYVNNESAWSLADPVEDGDYINAFAYKNEDYSDVYCFFDVNTVDAKKGDEITLTLKAAGYDEEWNPITVPVKDAVIMIGGEDSKYKTDADGKVTVKIELEGKILISAMSEEQTLVPPVCMVFAEDAVTDNENNNANNNIPDAPDDPVSDSATDGSDKSDETEAVTDAESKNDTNNTNNVDNADSGCGGTVSFSVISVVALAGAMLVKRNKND